MLAIEAMAKLFNEVDVVVTPSGGAQLSATNLTGNPCGYCAKWCAGMTKMHRKPEYQEAMASGRNTGGPGTPVSLTFLGGLYSDARLAAFARAYQEMTGISSSYIRSLIELFVMLLLEAG